MVKPAARQAWAAGFVMDGKRAWGAPANLYAILTDAAGIVVMVFDELPVSRLTRSHRSCQPFGKDDVMPKSRITTFVGGVSVLALALFAAGCSRSVETTTNHPADLEEIDMKSETRSTPLPGKIPPIDAAAPQTFETATFGLG
jgi:hypothetical protein